MGAAGGAAKRMVRWRCSEAIPSSRGVGLDEGIRGPKVEWGPSDSMGVPGSISPGLIPRRLRRPLAPREEIPRGLPRGCLF